MGSIREKDFINEKQKQLLNEVKKVIKEIANAERFSDSVCRELVDKVVIYSKTEYAFYIKGKKGNFFLDNKGNILYNKLEQKS